MTPVRLEPAASHSRVKHSATALPSSICRNVILRIIYHMTLLLFGGSRHVINNVMTTYYITLAVETRLSKVITMSVTTMQFSLK